MGLWSRQRHMQSAFPLSIVIAVAAFVFVAAYLLAQFITGRSPRQGANAGAAIVGRNLEPRQAQRLSAPRYRRRHDTGRKTARRTVGRRSPASYARTSGKRPPRAAGSGR